MQPPIVLCTRNGAPAVLDVTPDSIARVMDWQRACPCDIDRSVACRETFVMLIRVTDCLSETIRVSMHVSVAAYKAAGGPGHVPARDPTYSGCRPVVKVTK